MRSFVVICVVLTFGAGLVPAQGPEKHLDPPAPPRIEEFVYLYELTLTEDQDDWFNGETEIMIRTEITKPGHETGVWTMLINDIDMDGAVENDYTVLDGDLTDPERKGGKAKIYSHFECDPVVPMNLDIQLWEVDSTGAGDVIAKLGQAAAAVAEAGILAGQLWIGPTAAAIGALIDAIGNDEESLGTESRLVSQGISGPFSPTTKFQYRLLYVLFPTDNVRCMTGYAQAAWERLSDPTLEDSVRDYYETVAMGWDEDHPLTANPHEATQRLAYLQEALVLADALVFETETHPGMEHLPGTLKGTTVAIACDTLETEVNGALSGDVIPPFVYDANIALDAGRALARTGDYSGALATCSEHIPDLLVLNHPTVFFDDFERSDTRMWTRTEPPVIIIID